MTKANEKIRRSAFQSAFTPFFMEFCQGKISGLKLNRELQRIMKNLDMWDDPVYLWHRLGVEKALREAKDDGEGESQNRTFDFAGGRPEGGVSPVSGKD